jgi:hypothetical protein
MPESTTYSASEREWLYCRECHRNTNHQLDFQIQSVEQPINENVPPVVVDWLWQLLACMGCGTRCLRAGWKVEPNDPWEWTQYPETAEARTPKLAQYYLPAPVWDLYSQTIKARNAKALTLATAGIRATVEAICLNEKVGGANLKEKIDSLAASGKLTIESASYLHQHRYLGNEAVHDMVAPAIEEFEIALDILEHLLTSLYEMPKRMDQYFRLRAARGANVRKS